MKKLKFISVLLAMLTAFSCLSAFSTSAVILDPISSIEIEAVPANIYEKSVEEMLYGLKIKVNYADETTKTVEVSAENVEYEDNYDYLYTHAFSRSKVDILIDTSTRISIDAYNYVGDFIQFYATAYQGEADEYSYEAELNVNYPADYELPEIFCRDFLVYRNNPDNTLTLVNHAASPDYFTGEATNAAIEIPEEIFGKKVTSVADYALLGTTHPSSVTIPASVTSIGEYAFGYCFDPNSYGDCHAIPDNVNTSRLAYKLASAADDEKFLVCINFLNDDPQALSNKLQTEYLSGCEDYVFEEDMWCAYGTLTKEEIYSLQGIEDILLDLLYERDSYFSEEIYDFAEYTGYDNKMCVEFNVYADTEDELNAICAELSKLYFGGRTDYTVDEFGFMRIDATFNEIKAASKDESVGFINFYGADGIYYDLYKELYFKDSDYKTDIFAVDYSAELSSDSYTAYAEKYFSDCDYEVYSIEGQEVLIIKGATKQQIFDAGQDINFGIDLFGFPLIGSYDDIVIYGENGSAAQTYADNNSIKFISTGSEYELGDVNLDGIINETDATEILKYNVELVRFTDEQKALADIDGNGIINVSDVSELQRAIVNS